MPQAADRQRRPAAFQSANDRYGGVPYRVAANHPTLQPSNRQTKLLDGSAGKASANPTNQNQTTNKENRQ